MCQRVLIAMAFAGEPALLVADEPTTALDVITQAHIVRLLAEHAGAARHRGDVHHPRSAARGPCLQEFVVMYAGEMVEFGPAAAVLTAPSHPYTKSLLAAMPALTGPRHMPPALPDHMPGLASFARARRLPLRAALPGQGPCLRQYAAAAAANRRRALGALRGSLRQGGYRGFCHGAGGGSREWRERLTTASVDFENVRLSYHAARGFLGLRRSRFDAVKSATFKVREGEILGIVGESGSGKTSVGRLIVGLSGRAPAPFASTATTRPTTSFT